MGLMGVVSGRRVAVDTVAFIYLIEEHPKYWPLVRSLFEDADTGKREIVTSALTLLEVLVIPYRVGDLALAERYEAVLTQSRGVQLVDVDAHQLQAAAQLRAAFRFRTPDALQVAAALSRRCTTLITNDRDLPAIPGLEIVQLDDLLGAR
ncbi:MAG: PIN domain-containing protein [Gemmatimonadota bacterium]|nr:MAG: PIN domain-containing protein [Gemmatimonadota bacterium]